MSLVVVLFFVKKSFQQRGKKDLIRFIVISFMAVVGAAERERERERKKKKRSSTHTTKISARLSIDP